MRNAIPKFKKLAKYSEKKGFANQVSTLTIFFPDGIKSGKQTSWLL
ncbi:hypothetical protein [Hydrocoleum sp. CS-953]|nr:hypothetical protein [Hydrocoleum sp. CS-953]